MPQAISDITILVKTSGMSQWQNRWDKSTHCRHLYGVKQHVSKYDVTMLFLTLVAIAAHYWTLFRKRLCPDQELVAVENVPPTKTGRNPSRESGVVCLPPMSHAMREELFPRRRVAGLRTSGKRYKRS
ncbi:hypothetical protein ScPMuIL_015447 [Solemya velum]